MCKRNKKKKKKASTGCERETPHRKVNPTWDVQEKLPRKRRKKRSQLEMCKRNSPQKSKSNMGCVRETPQI